MKTISIGDQTYDVLDIVVDCNEVTQLEPVFRINEGEYAGVKFSLTNLRMDDTDESLMWYDLDVDNKNLVDQIKPIVDNFLISILWDQVQRNNDENQAAVGPPP